jgi:lysine-ketoglutarate reductase/saccharopine dehydrogenase-like protein (TIGR00300 family)
VSFSLPDYTPPDFTSPELASAPAARVQEAPRDGVAPHEFHGTSNHPEYVHIGGGEWILARENRMDCVLVLRDRSIEVTEARRLERGDPVVVGRRESGEDGVLVHSTGFLASDQSMADKFAFRTRGTRETPFSRSYDRLYELLRFERDHGYIVWVLGPAVAFDRDSRDAMQGLIENGFCHALLAGNALATHDLEAAHFRTGLGQDIYTQEHQPLGHYNHLHVLNAVRAAGSIQAAIHELGVSNGIIYACEKQSVPYVLAGSIRDDGPLPEVIADAYAAQDAMRVHARRATTVVALATQLHTIAFGNMTPSYQVSDDGAVRPVYFYVVDMSEFSADKLANRGSGQATAILTNVQDFMINLWNNLGRPSPGKASKDGA